MHLTQATAPAARQPTRPEQRSARPRGPRRHGRLSISALALALTACLTPFTAAAEPSLCDMTGQWQKTYDFAENGTINGRQKVNEVQFDATCQGAVGRYIGATAHNPSVFTVQCIERDGVADVRIRQKDSTYWAVIDGVRRGDVIRGTWHDGSGNRGDIVLRPYSGAAPGGAGVTPPPAAQHILANRTVNIRSGWRCPGERRCGQHLAFAGQQIKLYDKNNTNDLVPWKLVPVPGTTDEFYIRNRWRCPSEGRCDQHLSFRGQMATLYPQDNHNDLVPWKFVRVPGTSNQYYIYNRWRCGIDARCGQHLSFARQDAQLYPAGDTNGRVPWVVTIVE